MSFDDPGCDQCGTTDGEHHYCCPKNTPPSPKKEVKEWWLYKPNNGWTMACDFDPRIKKSPNCNVIAHVIEKSAYNQLKQNNNNLLQENFGLSKRSEDFEEYKTHAEDLAKVVERIKAMNDKNLIFDSYATLSINQALKAYNDFKEKK